MTAPSRLPKLTYMDARGALLIAAAVALVLSLTEILEFVELPYEPLVGRLFVSGSLASVGFVTSLVVGLGYAGLFLLMFLESASLPIPSEVVLPFAGYLVFVGSFNLEAVMVLCTLAGLSGALADYYVALKLGRPVARKVFGWLGINSKSWDGAERWLDKKGSWSILVARFIPGLRSAISLPAGALKMDLRSFTAMTAVGAFGWSALLVYVGYSAGNLWQTALARSAPVLTEVALFGVAIASASYVAFYVASKARPTRAS
ncbi:MAG: DedA family protein [Nitrososphaerota archaeon]|nr:DedA family protein [Nitrososphaerota archaeon]